VNSRTRWTLEDAELSVRNVNIAPRVDGGAGRTEIGRQLITRRIFGGARRSRRVDRNDGVSKLPATTPILTYLVNSLSVGDAIVPYSMVAASGRAAATRRRICAMTNSW
jgi:hypothetical protein